MVTSIAQGYSLGVSARPRFEEPDALLILGSYWSELLGFLFLGSRFAVIVTH